MKTSHFWHKSAFQLVLIGCGLFVTLTVIAMLAYPGGTMRDQSTHSYRFFENVFSDLGRTQARNGEANTLPMVLFVIGLNAAGIGMALFFIAYTQYFGEKWWLRGLSCLGSAAGVASAACFIGIAWTPSDVSRGLHNQFVLWAFRLFLAAVSVYIPALLLGRQVPRLQALTFLIFAGLLAGYLLLLTRGPRPNTLQGLFIQATGQKVIVYASIVSISLQAWWTLRWQRAQEGILPPGE
jgi:hypothetical membrane protein